MTLTYLADSLQSRCKKLFAVASPWDCIFIISALFLFTVHTQIYPEGSNHCRPTSFIWWSRFGWTFLATIFTSILIPIAHIPGSEMFSSLFICKSILNNYQLQTKCSEVPFEWKLSNKLFNLIYASYKCCQMTHAGFWEMILDHGPKTYKSFSLKS